MQSLVTLGGCKATLYYFLLLFINWSFKSRGEECERKLWDSQNHFVSLYFKSFFAFKFLTCIIRSWMLHLLKENKTRHIWPRKVDTFFFNTLNVMRGRKVKSRSAHRTQLKPRRMLPSWCKECFMLREKFLARRPWSAVMDLPSEVHVHSHGRSCTEIAADDDDNINILASSIFCNKNLKKWKLLQNVTTFEGSLTCFQKFLPKKRRNHF